MQKQEPIPRPRHLFPEVAALAIAVKRGLLRCLWWLKGNDTWEPVWSIGAIAGVAGIMMAVFLFFLQGPRLSADSHLQENSPRTLLNLPDPIEEELTPTLAVDEPAVPQEDLVFPDLGLPAEPPPQRPDFSASTFDRTQTRFPWNQRELATTVARPIRLPQQRVPDNWSSLALNARTAPLSESYLESGMAPPAQPLLRVASRDVLTPFERFTSTLQSGVVIEKVLPETMLLGEVAKYRILVTNDSLNDIDAVVVNEQLTSIQDVQSVRPLAAVNGSSLEWTIENLAAGETRELSVSVLPQNAAPIETHTTVRAISSIGALATVELPPEEDLQPPVLLTEEEEEILPVFPEVEPRSEPRPSPEPEVSGEPIVTSPPPVARPVETTPIEPMIEEPVIEEPIVEEPVAEPVRAPILKLAIEDPSTLEIGENLSLDFTVTNIGNAPAENVLLVAHLSDEFRHKHGETVQHTIERLEPGEVRHAVLRARTTTTGQGHLHTSLTLQKTETDSRDVVIPVVQNREQREASRPVSSANLLRPPHRLKSSEIAAEWKATSLK
ncbi:hypothetical protein KOR42_29480 [Thalassoglobus neptunius]|uniref:DUF11 domain-containing protein n=1 Tax=Thalassoglobus neptunius TaxID=1938619 RepID=A0A5C5WXM5_9PLAN|nr:DUF11 domain-containing protein [Thalassoglobus neptunius]TWT55320.1 hypothetical protein KOR42_29480 [Thalassoglobus neptunius]